MMKPGKLNLPLSGRKDIDTNKCGSFIQKFISKNSTRLAQRWVAQWPCHVVPCWCWSVPDKLAASWCWLDQIKSLDSVLRRGLPTCKMLGSKCACTWNEEFITTLGSWIQTTAGPIFKCTKKIKGMDAQKASQVTCPVGGTSAKAYTGSQFMSFSECRLPQFVTLNDHFLAALQFSQTRQRNLMSSWPSSPSHAVRSRWQPGEKHLSSRQSPSVQAGYNLSLSEDHPRNESEAPELLKKHWVTMDDTNTCFFNPLRLISRAVCFAAVHCLLTSCLTHRLPLLAPSNPAPDREPLEQPRQKKIHPEQTKI